MTASDPVGCSVLFVVVDCVLLMALPSGIKQFKLYALDA